MTVVAKFALIAGWTVQNVLFLFIIELEEHNLQQSFIGRDPIGKQKFQLPSLLHRYSRVCLQHLSYLGSSIVELSRTLARSAKHHG